MTNLKVAVFIKDKQIEYPFLTLGDLIILLDRTITSDFGWYAKSCEEVTHCNALVTNEEIEILGDL